MNHYELLEVRENASPEVIEMAYKALIRKYHPDVYKDDPEFAHDITQKINEAHRILADEKLRREYDEKLREERSGSSFEDEDDEDPEESYVLNSLRSKLPQAHTVLAVIAVILVFLCGFLFLKNDNLNEQITQTEAGLAALKTTLKTVEKSNVSLQQTRDQLNESLQFYYSNACVVTDFSKTYHHYGCPLLNNTYYYILDVKNAKRLGYSPCTHCWNESYDDFYSQQEDEDSGSHSDDPYDEYGGDEDENYGNTPDWLLNE